MHGYHYNLILGHFHHPKKNSIAISRHLLSLYLSPSHPHTYCLALDNRYFTSISVSVIFFFFNLDTGQSHLLTYN